MISEWKQSHAPTCDYFQLAEDTNVRMKKAGGPLNPACLVWTSMLRLFLGFP